MSATAFGSGERYLEMMQGIDMIMEAIRKGYDPEAEAAAVEWFEAAHPDPYLEELEGEVA